MTMRTVCKLVSAQAKFYLALIPMLSNRRTRAAAKFVWREYRQIKKFRRKMVKLVRKGVFPGAATGEQLDRIAALYGIERGRCESDRHLRERAMGMMQGKCEPAFVEGGESREVGHETDPV